MSRALSARTVSLLLALAVVAALAFHTLGPAPRAAASGNGWVCDQAPAMRYKASTPGDFAGIAGSAPVPYVATVTYDDRAFSVWFEDHEAPLTIPYASIAGWQYTSGTVTHFTPAGAQVFAHDSDGDGTGDRLKVAALHDRGFNFNTPSRKETLRDTYIVDLGCRWTGKIG